MLLFYGAYLLVGEGLAIGGPGEPPDKSDPKTPKVSDNRAYMGTTEDTW